MTRSTGQGFFSVERDDDAFSSAIESLIFPVSQTTGFDFSALAAGPRTAFPGLQDQSFTSPHPGNVTDALSTSSTTESADITAQPLNAGALTFTLHNIGGVTPGSQAEAGFQRAAALWESFFGDPVTVRLDVGFSSLGPGILGSTGAASKVVSYSAVRTALTADKSSSDDAAAVASLSAGSSLAFVTNNSAGARVFDSDASANNTLLNVSTADLKALGITTDANGQPVDTGAADASIAFSSDFNWDFDPSDGITAGAIDFVGVAFHEIGHALGFISGVDVVDVNTGRGPGGQVNLNPFAIFSVLDLFRYASAGVRDLSFGGSTYFSLDGGATDLALFSTGRFQGDGRQASHWKDNLGIGIMDPTSVPAGQANVVTSRDIQAMDVIGWNLVGNSTPGPAPGAGSISINDVQISEGDNGFKTETFTVTRSAGGVATAFDVLFSTADGTATVADNDYVPNVGILHFDANVNTQTISVIIRSDTKFEPDETFFVNLSPLTFGVSISDAQGVGTIQNDDPNPNPDHFDAAGIWTPAGNGSDKTWHVGDFNGDGKDDIFRYLGGEDVFLSNGTSFSHSGIWSPAGNGSDNQWHVGDFNGDGKDDIFRYLGGTAGADMFLSNGASFVHNGNWSPADPGSDGTWHVGDFNGDGKADIFRYLSGEDVFLSNGSSFGNHSIWSPAGNGSDGKWYVGDFNGDGKDDIFRHIEGSGVQMFLSTGTSFVNSGVWTPAGMGSDGTWHVGDFNGDGKADIFRYLAGQSGADVFLSNGSGFVHDTSWTGTGIGSDNQWYVGDFNGHGADDIFRQVSAGIDMLLSHLG
jgi:hypothetical protein